MGVDVPHEPHVMSHCVAVASPATAVALPVDPSSDAQVTLSAPNVVTTRSVTELLTGSIVVTGGAGSVCVIDLMLGPRPPVGLAINSDCVTHAAPRPATAPPLEVCSTFVHLGLVTGWLPS